MALPFTLDTTVPADSQNPSLGAGDIRTVTTWIADMLFGSVSPFTLTGAPMLIGTDGQTPHSVRLTNQTAATQVIGDVVALATANDTSVKLLDTQGALVPYVVAQQTNTNTSVGLYADKGVQTVRTQGTIVRGNYIRKSATSLKVEDTGVAMAATTPVPQGTVGVALTADASSVATAYLFGGPSSWPGVGVHVSSLTEATDASGAAHDFKTLTVSIADGESAVVSGVVRKSAGAAVSAQIGLKINGTQAIPNFTWSANSNATDAGVFEAVIASSSDANYQCMAMLTTGARVLVGLSQKSADTGVTGPITSLTITGNSGSNLVTMGVKNVVVYKRSSV